MTLLQDLELAIGGDGTFDLGVYEAEAMRAMEVVEKWLRGKELNLEMRKA